MVEDSERMRVAESRTKRRRKSHERAATGGTTVATAHENHGVGLALTRRPIKAATRCSQRAEPGIWHRVSRRFISAERGARTPGVCLRAPAYAVTAADRKMGTCPNELQRAVVVGVVVLWGVGGD